MLTADRSSQHLRAPQIMQVQHAQHGGCDGFRSLLSSFQVVILVLSSGSAEIELWVRQNLLISLKRRRG